MYVRKDRRKPFRPSASEKSLNKTFRFNLDHVSMLTSSKDNRRPEKPLYDAETGEQISIPTAEWTSKEGRLNLDAKTVLGMGTGRLNIFKEDSHVINPNLEKLDEYPNPIIKTFIDRGPLNPRLHQLWDPRTDQVKEYLLPYIPIDAGNEAANNISSDEAACVPMEHEAYPRTCISSNVSASSSHHSNAEESRTSSQASTDWYEDESWLAIEARYTDEIFYLFKRMETNKFLTKEEKAVGGLPRLRQIARQLR